MEHPLIQFASRYLPLSDAEKRAIVEEIPVKTFPKGSLLLSEGEIARECYFILQGCIREYRLIDGEEKTTAFYTEEQAVVAFSSYTQQLPAGLFFSCLEDTTAVVGHLALEAAMYERYPVFKVLSRLLIEQDFGKMQEAYAAFITSSPEERYLRLLRERPGLLQRVPQHQLASYLGVTPESLSRIRRRIARKP